MKKYKPMDCPVCNKFYFSKLQKGDVFPPHCNVCGWIYDLQQAKNPQLKQGANELSLEEYKQWYAQKVLEDPNYNYLQAHRPPKVPHMCPVCGKYEFEDASSFDICPYCGWEDDELLIDHPDYAGGPNPLSLNDYRKDYEKKIAEDPNYVWMKK